MERERTMRELVKQGYEEGRYEETYSRKTHEPEDFEKTLVQELIKGMSGKRVLDLGCGNGLPYDKYMSDQGCTVTGIDLSTKHINRAKENVPEATYSVGDFFDTKGMYDAIVSFYAIFHIPREEHAKLLDHIHSSLNKDGLILITLGTETMECDVNDDFAGAPMAWSSYTVEENKKLVQDAGFEILIAAEDYRYEKHLWILAKRRFKK